MALADVIAALSYALDITEGQPEGHWTKSCLIAMKIAEIIDLPSTDRSALFYGALLKDSGCSSNAAKVCSLFGADDREIKQSFKINDLRNKSAALSYMVRNVAPDRTPLARAAKLVSLIGQPSAGTELIKTRCSRGADIARKLGFSEQAAAAVRALDEHWDGRGEPYGLKGEEIPLLGRIACLAQTVEVYFNSYGLAAALDVARERSGKWFDPDPVSALLSFRDDQSFWATLDQRDVRDALAQCEPEEQRMFVDENVPTGRGSFRWTKSSRSWAKKQARRSAQSHTKHCAYTWNPELNLSERCGKYVELGINKSTQHSMPCGACW